MVLGFGIPGVYEPDDNEQIEQAAFSLTELSGHDDPTVYQFMHSRSHLVLMMPQSLHWK
jgi:hypothetical protein